MPTWVLTEGARSSPKLQDTYTLGQILGKGAFGVVYAAQEKSTDTLYACKSIAKAKLVSEEDVKDVQREIQVLRLVGQHANVAELINTYEDAAYVHLVLELCKGGELFDRVVAKGTFTEKMAADYFRTMVQVVHHLHQLGVMHRDIKPENFLLSSKDDSAELKLADFGLSTYFRHGQKFTHIVGSAYYVAPETSMIVPRTKQKAADYARLKIKRLANLQVLRRNYGYEADIWSLGVILYILLSGLPPFWGNTEEDIFRMVLKGKIDMSTAPWPQISDAAKDCVLKLLVRDPARRPTAAEILQHDWLKEQGVAPDIPIDNVVISRMRRFAAMNKLKKAAMLEVARCMKADQIQGLKELFQAIDKDCSGTITVEELRTSLTEMGSTISDAELMAVMEAADLDNNGLVDYEEFIAATLHLNRLEQEAAYQSAFSAFDKDNSGCLSPEEIESALESLGVTKEEINQVLQEHDTNHDGEIDYHEFLAMMQANNSELQQAASFFRKRPGTFSMSEVS